MRKRAKHNLGCYKLLTGDMGLLYPVGLVEALPADTIRHHTNVLIRVSPLAAPVMHPVTARVHHFFVPMRLIWPKLDQSGEDWESFITGGDDGNNSAQIPKVTTTGTAKDLLDYFGVGQTAGVEISALPIRAYNMIYNEFYRDQDLVTERDQDDLTVPKIAWEKDPFTVARPWTQKGDQVTLPLGDVAPVKGIGKMNQTYGLANRTVYETGESATKTYANAMPFNGTGDNNTAYLEEDPDNAGFPAVYADLANALGANINDVRLAFALQRFQEARARYGNRYVEYLKYLGARPADARLQRPEFLGGGKTRLNFSEIMQTAPETGQEPSTAFGVADMYGHGIGHMRSNAYTYTAQEHGYIITMLSVRPKTIYQDGIDRTFLKNYKEDFFQMELQHIGQQEVYNGEVYLAHSNPKGTMSYQDRYTEYRRSRSTVCGEFRDTLDYWHMARKFTSEPVLNASFVECDATKRIHNVQSQDALWIATQHKMVARRLVDRSAYARVL